MRSILLALVALSAIGLTPTSAQVSPEICGELSGSVGRAAEGSIGFLDALTKVDTAPLAAKASGELKAAAQRASQAREQLLPAIRDYARSLEDLAYQLKVCGRK